LAEVAALTEGVLNAMFLTKLKTVTVVLLVLGVVALGGLYATQARAQPAPIAGAEGKAQGKERPDLSNTQFQLEVKPDKDVNKDFPVTPGRGLRLAVPSAADKKDFGVTPGKGFRLTVPQAPTAKLDLGVGVNLQLAGQEFRLEVLPSTQFQRYSAVDLKKKERPDLSGTQFRPQIRPDLSGARFQPDVKRGDNKPAADAKTGPSTPAVRTLKGHSAAVYFAAFSPNGDTLVTAAKDNNWAAPRVTDELIIWDVTAQKAKHKIQFQAPAHIWSMTLSADGKTVAVGTPVGIELRDAVTGKTKRTLEGPWAKSTGPFCLAFAPDGKTLAAGGSARDNIVRLWDVQTGKLTGTLKGHEDAVVGVRFSPDGKTLASTGGMDDTTVRYWDLATRQLRITVNKAKEESKDGTEAVDGNWQSWPMAFSPDGKILARGRDTEVKFWDARTGAVRDRAIGGSHPGERTVQSIAFSPDGKLVAGGRDSGAIDVWETRPADGKNGWRIGVLKQTLKEHSHPVMALAFSPSGELLASGDVEGKVRVWKMTKPVAADPRQIFEFWMGFFR
jgi:WD40 repeat protein